MPDFEYQGPGERTYPETRDAYGVNLGTVKPGDTARFDQAPDQYWTPYEDGGTGDGGEDGETGGEGDGGEPPADPETPDETPHDEPPGM